MGWKQIGLLVAGCAIWPGVLHAADCTDPSRRSAEAREALQRCRAHKGDCAQERRWVDGARTAERDCRTQARREREHQAPARTQARMLAPAPSKSSTPSQGRAAPSGRQR